LSLGEAKELDSRYLRCVKALRRLQATVSADQGKRFVHQHGGAETKGFDTLRNLPDLRLRVDARVARVGFDLLDRQQAIYALPRDHCVPSSNVVDGTDLERVGGPIKTRTTLAPNDFARLLVGLFKPFRRYRN
jgi:hypothetical protein